jgi:aquaporin Z
MQFNHTHSAIPLVVLQRHWPEYVMEAAELSAFMISACVFDALLEHPGSPVHRAIPSPLARRAVMGLLMGLTAIGIVYSPLGRRSGAHMNPAFTFTFWRLGKIGPWDALFYAAAQCAGGIGGVLCSKMLLRAALSHPAVNYAVTVPGPLGTGVAWVAELLISFALMLSVLVFTNRRTLAAWTGLFVGCLIALYVTIEAPFSGMSMNPARTLGSAVFAGEWTAFWVYVTAPLVGMSAASLVYVRARGAQAVLCAKLHHTNRYRCIFCDHQHQKADGQPHACAPPAAPDGEARAIT